MMSVDKLLKILNVMPSYSLFLTLRLIRHQSVIRILIDASAKAGFFNGGDITPQGAIRGDLNNLKNWGAILNNWGAISQLQILL